MPAVCRPLLALVPLLLLAPTLAASAAPPRRVAHFWLRQLATQLVPATNAGVVAFSAERLPATPGLVHLRWLTQAALGQSFTIQRSADGHHFLDVGYVAGDEGPATQTEFAFSQPYALAATYRVGRFDRAGRLGFSPPRFVPAAPLLP